MIRDNPTDRTATHDCVRRAIARAPAGRAGVRDARAGGSCRPTPRSAPPGGSRDRGARVIDLTRYFCGRRRCLPVVGGVLVHKDVDHLTQQFARTLGPFLLRRIDRLDG